MDASCNNGELLKLAALAWDAGYKLAAHPHLYILPAAPTSVKLGCLYKFSRNCTEHRFSFVLPTHVIAYCEWITTPIANARGPDYRVTHSVRKW